MLDNEQLCGRVDGGENCVGKVEAEVVDARWRSKGCLRRSGDLDCDTHDLGVTVVGVGMDSAPPVTPQVGCLHGSGHGTEHQVWPDELHLQSTHSRGAIPAQRGQHMSLVSLEPGPHLRGQLRCLTRKLLPCRHKSRMSPPSDSSCQVFQNGRWVEPWPAACPHCGQRFGPKRMLVGSLACLQAGGGDRASAPTAAPESPQPRHDSPPVSPTPTRCSRPRHRVRQGGRSGTSQPVTRATMVRG